MTATGKRTEKVMGVGVAQHRKLGDRFMYRAVQGKLGGPFPAHYRVWWIPGRFHDGSIVYGPEEFRGIFEKVQEYKVDPPADEEAPAVDVRANANRPVRRIV